MRGCYNLNYILNEKLKGKGKKNNLIQRKEDRERVATFLKPKI